MKPILINEIKKERCNAQALDAYNASLGNNTQNNELKYDVSLSNIYNDVSDIDTNTNTISSLGDYASTMDIQLSQDKVNELKSILDKDSLAYKILNETKNYSLRTGFKFSDKQKWVIAYELNKNNSYKNKLGKEIADKKAKSEFKLQQSKNKLATNKLNAKSNTDLIKQNGKKLGDYYKFLNSNKEFRKEFYNKKYSAESVKRFLQN